MFSLGGRDEFKHGPVGHMPRGPQKVTLLLGVFQKGGGRETTKEGKRERRIVEYMEMIECRI